MNVYLPSPASVRRILLPFALAVRRSSSYPLSGVTVTVTVAPSAARDGLIRTEPLFVLAAVIVFVEELLLLPPDDLRLSVTSIVSLSVSVTLPLFLL